MMGNKVLRGGLRRWFFKASAYALFILASVSVVVPAQAFGPEGHRIVGEIAQRFLLPDVRARIARDFAVADLAEVANWADDIKGERRQKSWHYTNIRKGEKDYVRERDCPDGACVTEIIPKYEKILRDTSAPSGERGEALKYLVHFVGDAHQPLHVGNREDRGGNKIQVRFRGEGHNLHALWDQELIPYGKHHSVRYYAEKLAADISPDEATAWRTGTAADWTRESRQDALQTAYRGWRSPSGELSPEYVARAQKVLELRLKQAGVRLAHLLNNALR
jgi:hypothetical protein